MRFFFSRAVEIALQQRRRQKKLVACTCIKSVVFQLAIATRAEREKRELKIRRREGVTAQRKEENVLEGYK